ncbi:MAG: DNA repair exonuclease [Planctomycetes bacterium]|nr:DNA repair exonuclease [Planctomycetota bacterium]
MSFRLLHTADWQLGMTRHYLDADAQARFTQARFEAIGAIGRIAREQSCEAVVCCGDVFEHNAVDRKTISRACDALRTIPVPVFLLPGNHDPLDAGSVFRSTTFAAKKPVRVHVLETAEPVALRPGVEIVGAPWTSKRPLRDLVADALERLAPKQDGVRIVVAHGAVDALSPDPANPALISVAAAERAIAEGRLHYLALGDRHSLTDVGATGRIRYSGTPEPTDYDEVEPGHVLVVDVASDGVTAQSRRTGSWTYRREKADLTGAADVELLRRKLGEIADKARTIVKLDLVGTLTVKQRAALDELLDEARETLAALEISTRASDLVVVPEDADFADLGLAGFAATAVAQLREQTKGATPEAAVARDALGLLLRLARGAA